MPRHPNSDTDPNLGSDTGVRVSDGAPSCRSRPCAIWLLEQDHPAATVATRALGWPYSFPIRPLFKKGHMGMVDATSGRNTYDSAIAWIDSEFGVCPCVTTSC